MRPFQAMYDIVLGWSRHPRAERYLAALSASEAIFFPVPPDVMLAPMCLARPRQAWRYATWCTLASVGGAFIGYLLGDWAGETIRPWLEQSRYADSYHSVVESFTVYGVIYMVLAGFSPIPFKIFTVSAGLLSMPLLPFLLASAAARAARFFLVAGLIRVGGPQFAERLRQWVDGIGWSVLAIALVGLIGWGWIH